MYLKQYILMIYLVATKKTSTKEARRLMFSRKLQNRRATSELGLLGVFGSDFCATPKSYYCYANDED